jgi:hypothetical protein
MGIKNGNVVQAKVGTVARTNTSDKYCFMLPANAMVIGVRVIGANSDSATSATLTFKSRPVDGSAAAATFATVDAKNTVNGQNDAASMTGIAFSRTALPVHITAAYSESGAATVGGEWTFMVEYL